MITKTRKYERKEKEEERNERESIFLLLSSPSFFFLSLSSLLSYFRVFVILLLLSFSVFPAFAFQDPIDTAGPLTVQILGPEKITRREIPYAVQVILENKSGKPLQGTLCVDLIDRWKVEPSQPAAFSLPGGGRSTVDFHVTAAPGSYSAHYPIHVRAKFTAGEQSFEAHPILIVPTKFDDPPPTAAPVEWKPVQVGNPSLQALAAVPTRRVVVQVFNEPPLVMPAGWEGSESRSRAVLSVRMEAVGGRQRPVVVMHPPWYSGHAGTMAVEFPLQLPSNSPLLLRFANAMTEERGDGVTFRVRVAPIDAPAGQLGQVIFERHTKATAAQPAKVDLSAFAGKTVRLQLESHPGPKNDTSFDQSQWQDPTLIVGTPSPPAPFPPPNLTGTRVLGTTSCGGNKYEVRVRPGQRGLLDAAIGFVNGQSRLWFNGFEVQVLRTLLQDSSSPIVLLKAIEEPGEGYQVRHRFAGPSAAFDLVGRLWIDRGALRARFHLDNTPLPKPWQVVYLEDVSAGPWSHTARQVYAGPGNVLRLPEAFHLGFDGHRLATSFVGFDFADGPSLVVGTDLPPSRLDVQPDDRMYALRAPHGATFSFIPSPSVWEGVKMWREVNGLKAAGGVTKAAGRFVFDLWGGHYERSAGELQHAFRYGLTDSMVVWHNWQRWGYDYRLPQIYPPNPQLGTLEQMQGLARACKEAGVVFAVHDNYIDFYPDADGFSYPQRIAFNSPNQPRRAWLHEARQAQSYQYRADQIEPFLQANLEQIRKNVAPTGYFIDVWSSAGPYDYWTSDGQFFSRVYTRDTWGRHFAWIRDFLGNQAPQISESGHDQLIGWLDGAQANHLRVGRPIEGYYHWAVWDVRCADAERVAWLDAAHHDRFVLHGAGYPGRYEGGLPARLHGIYSDDYMATEVLTGHPAMVSNCFSRDVVRKYWLLHGLGRALAMGCIDRVEFDGGDLHRQRVLWQGGGEVVVNRGETDWTTAGVTLPPFGFLARTPGKQSTVETSITRRDGLIVETARSADELYVNARRPVGGPRRIRLAVEQVRYQGDRRFELTLKWHADDPIPAAWTPFFHFVDQKEAILFQASHVPGRFTTPRQGDFTATASGRFPKEIKPGTSLQLRFGLYRHETGERLAMANTDDGQHRTTLGTLALEGPADNPSGITWTAVKPEPDPLMTRMNPGGKPIDFGAIVTADGCRLTRDRDFLRVTPLPMPPDASFTARLRWPALPWTLPQPTHLELLADDGKVLDRRPIVREGDLIVVECPGEAFACRLVRQ
jgi:hypothetical protein